MHQDTMRFSIYSIINDSCYDPITRVNHWQIIVDCEPYLGLHRSYANDGRVDSITIDGRDLFCDARTIDKFIAKIKRLFSGIRHSDSNPISCNYDQYVDACYQLSVLLLEYHATSTTAYLRYAADINAKFLQCKDAIKDYDGVIKKLHKLIESRHSAICKMATIIDDARKTGKAGIILYVPELERIVDNPSLGLFSYEFLQYVQFAEDIGNITNTPTGHSYKHG